MYYEEGSLLQEGAFLGGKLHGLVRTYYKNGFIKTEEIYNQDTLVQKLAFKERWQSYLWEQLVNGLQSWWKENSATLSTLPFLPKQ
jgi:antitoxin component YwqK of YwqJK toxin-antitoxin module